MSEFTQTRNVMDVNPDTIPQLHERMRFIADTERALYPSHQAGLRSGLLNNRDPQVDMPDPVRTSVKTSLNRFREVHAGSIRRFVPEALDSGAEGSGGVADVAGYLATEVLTIERSAK